MKLESTVAGIPCLVAVGRVEPVVPGNRRGHPDNWDEDSGGEIEFTILDRKGYPAPWLANKLTIADTYRIEQQILEIKHDDY